MKRYNDYVFKESKLTWDDIIYHLTNEDNNFWSEIIGLIKYVDDHKNKYRQDISEFMDWFENWGDLDERMTNSKPSDHFEHLPSNDWKFYKKYWEKQSY